MIEGMSIKPLLYQQNSIFPPPESADEHGLVAITPDLSAAMLLDAYSHGIFPWSENPVCWFSPDPRAVFLREHIRVPRKMGKIMRKGEFRVTYDTAFRRVIEACADSHRHQGEWISPGFINAYSELHEHGYAHSVEVWQEEHLVGGLYGVQLHGLFAGESMFYTVSNASKVAFAALVAQLDFAGIMLLDAQVINEHTANLGAVQVHRSDYLAMLHYALNLRVRFHAQKWPTPPHEEMLQLLTHTTEKA